MEPSHCSHLVKVSDSNFSVCGRNPPNVTIQKKAIEQYFPVVLFVMLYKEVPIFEYANEILKYDHSIDSY